MDNNNCDTKINVSNDTSLVTDNAKSIVNDIKFSNEPSNDAKIAEKKRKRKEKAESKRLADEKYNHIVQEQQYKRLMHLLNRSKFYASYIVNKINNSLVKDAEVIKRNEKELDSIDENTPPQEIEKKKSHNSQTYISKDVKRKVHINKNKLNLSENEIEYELVINSESKTKDIDNVIVETPKYFNGDLRDYQKEGLKWLKVLYENGINGILADEMGLGKTIQVIALLCHLLEKKQDGPYLLVAPLSTIPNWMLEFEKFAPKLPVVLFHGTQEKHILKRKIKQKYKITETYSTLPIVLTTFEVPLHESNFIKSLNWKYIIIDEGHRIKNHKCQLLQVLKSCRSMNRLLLTGTPLQNNLAELWSLLNFLLPEIFDDLTVFESWFDAKEHQGDEGTKKFLKLEEDKRVLSSLREILQPFLLRREKANVCLDIPPKKELIVYAPLTQLQHDLYKALINRDIDEFNKIEEDLIIHSDDGNRPKRKCALKSMYIMNTRFEREVSLSTTFQQSDESMDSDVWKQVNPKNEQNLITWNKYTNVTNDNRDFLIHIHSRHHIFYKKIVNHPYLIHYPLGLDLSPKIDEELIKSSGKLLVLDAMLARLKKRGHRVLLFTTMTMILDIIEDYLSLRNYKYIRLDGTTKLIDRKERIEDFNTNSEIFLFLMTTRAGGVGLNLVGADTVIVYDCDWNPQVDIQAVARCHRIGQTRPVMIYKLCTKGTIDEAIINRAEAKRLLEKVVISKHIKEINVRNKADLIKLQKMLESNEHQVVASENEVFTEEELNQLLDRSGLFKKQIES
ncbi:PREDICTED: lymphoid-specific helicase-like [Eufriesea mexicana]|uniref:lymphoid-specific helicase-like n=1 Tax=Eufriesea mexicana TaxID=516756 RepID=UPI00083BAA8C|nr:PREDICTED: lymphoid-specific helicase-like [Eufriesea mexicana]